MGTWMWPFATAAVFGCWLGPAWTGPAVPPLLALSLLAGAGFLRPGSPWRFPLAALTGYLFAVLALGEGLERRLPQDESDTERVLEGRVTGLPEMRYDGRGGPRQRFRLRLEPGGDLRQVSLTFHGVEEPLEPGERVRLRARLFAPRARVNEGGFDRARHDLAAGIDAHGYVTAMLRRDRQARGVDAKRARISRELRQRFHAHPVAARWLPALVTGDRRHLSERDWELLRRTGTAHLMAISGLHITLVAGLVWWLCRWLPAPLWRRFGVLSAQQLAVLPALAAAGGYAVLAGFTLPTQRALVMVGVVFAGVLLRRRWSSGTLIATALVAVLLWHPLAPLATGFWLSFGAVSLLVLAADAGWRGMLRAQAILGLGLGAICAWLFGQWGSIAPVANLILIPLFSLLVVPVALAGTFVAPAGWLAALLGPLLGVVEALLARLVQLALPLPPVPDLPTALALGLAVAVLFAGGCVLPRWCAPFLLLPWLYTPPPELPPGHFRLVVFDVGQGQALAIRTRHALVLYDLGPGWPGGNAGDTLLGPWVDRRGVPVTLAFASHGDSDHAGGLAGMAERIPAGRLFSGEPERVPGAGPCLRGQHWWLDGVRFEVLWPAPGIELRRSNNRSCVVRVSGAGGSVLLTGDIEKPVEYWLSRRDDLRADILQVPHHGSGSSSSYTLLRAVQPRHAFASAGHLNAFGHPAGDVRRRFRELGIPLLVNAETGMIVFPLNGQHNAAPILWRRISYRPWRAVIE